MALTKTTTNDKIEVCGISQHKLARIYGTSQAIISGIVLNKSYVEEAA